MSEEPRTSTGRRLFTDMEPMDLWESGGVTPEDVVAIEAEAIEPLLALVRAALAILTSDDGLPPDDEWAQEGLDLQAALRALPADILAAADR